MTSILIKVTGATSTATVDGKLTSGMVGVPVTIEYDDSWDGLFKTASFQAGNFVRSRINIGTATSVPWEVMRHSGENLEVGVEGRDADGNIVIPTTWAVAGKILPGAVSSTPAAPNPSVGAIPSGGSAIDDSQVSNRTTWSSEKIVDVIKSSGTNKTISFKDDGNGNVMLMIGDMEAIFTDDGLGNVNLEVV